MEPIVRTLCLLLALLVLPGIFVAYCLGMSRERQGLVLSYLASYVLLGCVAGWCLVAGLWPSGASHVFRWFLLTAAPLSCFGLAVALQARPRPSPLDRSALMGCYVYPALVAAGLAHPGWRAFLFS